MTFSTCNSHIRNEVVYKLKKDRAENTFNRVNLRMRLLIPSDCPKRLLEVTGVLIHLVIIHYYTQNVTFVGS